MSASTTGKKGQKLDPRFEQLLLLILEVRRMRKTAHHSSDKANQNPPPYVMEGTGEPAAAGNRSNADSHGAKHGACQGSWPIVLIPFEKRYQKPRIGESAPCMLLDTRQNSSITLATSFVLPRRSR
jgi:hypothetical protein